MKLGFDHWARQLGVHAGVALGLVCGVLILTAYAQAPVSSDPVPDLQEKKSFYWDSSNQLDRLSRTYRPNRLNSEVLRGRAARRSSSNRLNNWEPN